ncbi:MAG: DUF86 domain-containing protein [Flavobacteriaceae bacterium]|nr:DUF86 domain-containing protein [Flavobacteriaceae bacterium]
MKARQQRRILLQLGDIENLFIKLHQESKDILSKEKFLAKETKQLAIIKLTQDICEVATTIVKIDRRLIKNYRDIEWLSLKELREKIVHEHFRIDKGTVWNMVVNNSIQLENKFLKFKEYINSHGIDSKIESFSENDSIL